MIIDNHSDERLIKRVGGLRRHWLWILEAAVACALGAMIISLFQAKIYRATTHILISESKIGEPTRDSNLQQMAMLPTYVPFLDNDALVAESLKKFRLDQPPYELTAEVFRRRYMDVRVPKSTRLLELTVEFPDPRLAADLANEIAQGAVRFNDRLNAADTTSSRDFLKGHLDQAAAGMENAASRRLAIQQEARIEDREKDLAVLLHEKDALYARIQQLRVDLIQNDVRAKSLEKALEAEPETVLLKKNVTSDRYLERITEKLDLNDLALGVTEESINQVRESLRKDFIASTINAAAQRMGLEAASARLDEVNREISQTVLSLVALRSKLAAAEQAYTLASEGIRTANREYDAASVTVSAKSQDMKQIAHALPPERPVRPNVLINTIAGFLFGAVLSAFGVLALQGHRRPSGEEAVAEDEVKALAAGRS